MFIKPHRVKLVRVSFTRQGPHRLVVRTSRRGRDNPGSTPGVDIFINPMDSLDVPAFDFDTHCAIHNVLSMHTFM